MANRFLTLVAGIPKLLKRVIFPNDGLRIEDDDASHLLTLLAAAMSANGSLTLDVANGTRRLVINGNTTLNGNNTGDLTLGVPAAAVFSITGQELSVVDAGADKIPFWDDSAGNMAYATLGSGLTMTGTTLSASGETYYVNGDVSSSSTTVANVSGLACSIAAGEDILIELLGFCTTAATTTGIRLAVTGPALPTAVQLGGFIVASDSTVRSKSNVTAFATDWTVGSGPGGFNGGKFAGFAGLTGGGSLYLSTNGQQSHTAPGSGLSQQVAVAKDADEIFIDIEEPTEL